MFELFQDLYEQKQKQNQRSSQNNQTKVSTYGLKYVKRNNQLEKFKAPSLQPTKDFEPKFHIDLVLVKEVNWPLLLIQKFCYINIFSKKSCFFHHLLFFRNFSSLSSQPIPEVFECTMKIIHVEKKIIFS